MALKRYHRITMELTVSASEWKKRGMGDRPSTGELTTVLQDYLASKGAEDVKATVTPVANNAGRYIVSVILSMNTTVWRKLGFGDRASRMEIEDMLDDFFQLPLAAVHYLKVLTA